MAEGLVTCLLVASVDLDSVRLSAKVFAFTLFPLPCCERCPRTDAFGTVPHDSVFCL